MNKYSNYIKNKHCKCNKLITNNSAKCEKCRDKLHSKQMKGKNNSNYKNGKYMNNKCLDCKKSIRPQRIRCEKCKNKMLSIILLGENNPNWKGGIGRLPYSYDFKQNRLLALKRDNYKCQVCGRKGTHAHHIDYNKQNSKINNLITTCLRCNCKVNANRDYWYAYFMYVIAGLKE
jgi:hypothetical protein